MSNEAEREAFESWCASVGYHTERDMFQREKYQSSLTWELWRVWQAGAEWQRTQAQPADALVEGLETIALESTDEQARCCAHHYLAAYRAAQEGK